MNDDIFLQVKKSLNILQVAEDFGITANRSNKALSPFSNEKTPSFQLYPDTQSFYCYSTNQDGTVIDLVMKMCNLTLIEATKLLNDKYNLGLNIGKSVSAIRNKELQEEKRLEKAMQQYKRNIVITLSEIIRTYRQWINKYCPANMNDLQCDKFVQALTGINRIEYLSEVISNSTGKEIMSFYSAYKSEVKTIVDRYRKELSSSECKGQGT